MSTATSSTLAMAAFNSVADIESPLADVNDILLAIMILNEQEREGITGAVCTLCRLAQDKIGEAQAHYGNAFGHCHKMAHGGGSV